MPMRGVWECPFVGPNGETYLYIVNRKGVCLEAPIAIPKGGDVEAVAENLRVMLDHLDPAPISTVARRAPGFTRRAVDNRRNLRLISA